LISVDDMVITKNLAETMQFKEELALYDTNDDSNNAFFKIAERKITKEGKKSSTDAHYISKTLFLELPKKKVYLGKTQAKTFVSIFNMSLQGYSFSRMLEHPLEYTLEELIKEFQKNGLLR